MWLSNKGTSHLSKIQTSINFTLLKNWYEPESRQKDNVEFHEQFNHIQLNLYY